MRGDVVFISYYRKNASSTAHLIRDRLGLQFGPDRVFLDTTGIGAGQHFPSTIDAALRRARVMLVIIDRHFLDADPADFNRRFIDDPQNWVRREIEAGLQARFCAVIPVLIDGADLPPAHAGLPPSIEPIRFLQAARVRHDTLDQDLAALVAVVVTHLAAASTTRAGIAGARGVPVRAIAVASLAAIALFAWGAASLRGDDADRPAADDAAFKPFVSTTVRAVSAKPKVTTTLVAPSRTTGVGDIFLPALPGHNEACATNATTAPDGSAIVVGWSGVRGEGDPCCPDVLSRSCKPQRRDRVVWQITADGRATYQHLNRGGERSATSSQEFYAVVRHEKILVAAGGSWAVDDSSRVPDEADFGVSIWVSSDSGKNWLLQACDDAPPGVSVPTCATAPNGIPDSVMDLASNGKSLLAVGLLNGRVGIWSGAVIGSSISWRRVNDTTGLPEGSRANAVAWSRQSGAWVIGGRVAGGKPFLARLSADGRWLGVEVRDGTGEVSALAATGDMAVAVGDLNGDFVAWATTDSRGTWRSLEVDRRVAGGGTFYNASPDGDRVTLAGWSSGVPVTGILDRDRKVVVRPSDDVVARHGPTRFVAVVPVGDGLRGVASSPSGGGASLRLVPIER